MTFKLAHAQSINQATFTKARERITDSVRQLAEVRCDLVIRERSVLLEQREDSLVHAVSVPATAVSVSRC
jgi:hypothetical protein